MNRGRTVDVILRLGAVVAVSVLVIGLVHMITEPAGARNRQRIVAATVASMFDNGPGTRIVPVDADPSIIALYRRGDDGVSVVRVRHVDRFDHLDLLVGVEPDGTIIEVRVLERGYRTWVGGRSFFQSFVGFGGDQPDSVKHADLTPEPSDAVSGATITYRIVAEMVHSASSLVRREQ